MERSKRLNLIDKTVRLNGKRDPKDLSFLPDDDPEEMPQTGSVRTRM